MTVQFGKASLLVNSAMSETRKEWAREEIENKKVQALAEKLDDRFALVYSYGRSEIPHDKVEILFKDRPGNTEPHYSLGMGFFFDLSDITDINVAEYSNLKTSLGKKFTNGSTLPMYIKPSPKQQWVRALKRALKLQDKMQEEGKL